jgi:EAL domain-containing protein (putative c-di-GMP-specific phosphodiesterase class I)
MEEVRAVDRGRFARSDAPPGAARSRRTTDRFVAFAFAAADLLVEVEPDGRITFAAGAFRSRLGSDPDAFLDRQIEDLASGEDRAQLAASVATLAGRGRLQPTLIRLGDPARTPFVLSGLAIPTDTGASGALCLTFGPIPTGVATAADAIDKDSFARAAEARLRDPARPTAIGFMEVDRAGAEALANRPNVEGQVLKELLSTIEPGAQLGRLAQGRWGVLQREGADICEVSDRVEAALWRLGIGTQITATVLSLVPGKMTEMQAVRALRAALLGFAHSGHKGLAAAGVAQELPGFLSELETRAKGIGQAIVEERFRLDYQPIVRLAGRQLLRYEAFIRPLGGLPRTSEFVSLAEAAGLIEELDLAVMRLALGDSRGRVPISVNISGLSAQSATFRERLLKLLGPEPRGLTVEITETADIEQEEEAVTFVEALRALSVPVSLGNFGVGPTSFRHLRKFKPDFVMIDGSYVAAAMRQERERAFVGSMVDLARSGGAKVAAEGVESEEAAALMGSLGVEFGQGWLFGRPEPLPRSGPIVRRSGNLDDSWV